MQFKLGESHRECLITALGVEDDLWDLAILHTGAIVVPCRIAELEGDLPTIMTIHCHLPQPFGPIVAVQPFQSAHSCVVCVWLDLQRLFEHGPECGICPIR